LLTLLGSAVLTGGVAVLCQILAIA